MEYITTRALPAFVLLLCQTKSFSSDPFLIIIPYKSRVNTLLYFHLDDAKDVHMHMSLDALRSFLFWEEVSRQLTHLHAQLVVLTELRSVCSQFGMYTNPTQTGNSASDAVFLSLVMGEKIKTKFKLFSRLDKQTLGLLQSAYKTGWKALEIAVYNEFMCNSSFQ